MEKGSDGAPATGSKGGGGNGGRGASSTGGGSFPASSSQPAPPVKQNAASVAGSGSAAQAVSEEGAWSPPETALSKMQETFLEMLYGGWVDRRRVINLL